MPETPEHPYLIVSQKKKQPAMPVGCGKNAETQGDCCLHCGKDVL